MKKTDVINTIFSPKKLRGVVTVKNRLMRSATNVSCADLQGFVTQATLDLYRELTQGGVGLCITGIVSVEERARSTHMQMGIWDDKYTIGLRKLSDTIHQYGDGVVAAVQLCHTGSVAFGYSYGQVDTGYSFLNETDEGIWATINAFGQAANRVKLAGFDAIAIHGAHGYLFSESITPFTNKRTDKWGGSLENRLRFPLEVYRAMREKVGDDYPLLLKLNTDDYEEGGMGPEEYAEVAHRFAEVGFDLIELSGGLRQQIELRKKLKREAAVGEAYFRGAVDRFKQAVGDTPLALVGGIRSPLVMKEILDEGKVDFLSMSRPFLTEPDFPNRIKAGDLRPCRCVSCSLCLKEVINGPAHCVFFNPRNTKEVEERNEWLEEAEV